MVTRQHFPGCYRVSNEGEYFGQVRRNGREWSAEIRKTKSGDIVRYAGVWATKRDAVSECGRILERGDV